MLVDAQIDRTITPRQRNTMCTRKNSVREDQERTRFPSNYYACSASASCRGFTNRTWHASAPDKSNGTSPIAAASQATVGMGLGQNLLLSPFQILGLFLHGFCSKPQQPTREQALGTLSLCSLSACSIRSLQHGGACCVAHLQSQLLRLRGWGSSLTTLSIAVLNRSASPCLS